MGHPDRARRLFIGALCVGFVFLNTWAYRSTPPHGPGGLISQPISALRDVIPSHRWATVVASDLFFGWCLMAIVIACNERRARVAAAWIVAMFVIGNLVAGFYLIRNLPGLRAALASEGTNADR